MDDRGIHIFARHSSSDVLKEIIRKSESVEDLRFNIDQLCLYFSERGIVSLLKECMYWEWKKSNNGGAE